MTIQEVGIALQSHAKGWLPVYRSYFEQTWEHPTHGTLFVRKNYEGRMQFSTPLKLPGGYFSEWQERTWYDTPTKALEARHV